LYGGLHIKTMAKVIQLHKTDNKLYGECSLCGSDQFHLLLTEDEEVDGFECAGCREVTWFDYPSIILELE